MIGPINKAKSATTKIMPKIKMQKYERAKFLTLILEVLPKAKTIKTIKPTNGIENKSCGCRRGTRGN